MGMLEDRISASSALIVRRSPTMLCPPLVGNKKRKRNNPKTKETPRSINQVQKELEEIKRSTVTRLESLLRDTTSGLVDGDNVEGADADDARRELAQLRIQMESALFDVAHWK